MLRTRLALLGLSALENRLVPAGLAPEKALAEPAAESAPAAPEPTLVGTDAQGEEIFTVTVESRSSPCTCAMCSDATLTAPAAVAPVETPAPAALPTTPVAPAPRTDVVVAPAAVPPRADTPAATAPTPAPARVQAPLLAAAPALVQQPSARETSRFATFARTDLPEDGAAPDAISATSVRFENTFSASGARGPWGPGLGLSLDPSEIVLGQSA